MTSPSLTISSDPTEVARRVAGELLSVVDTAVRDRGRARIVLTGGGTGIASLAAIAADPRCAAIPWETVEMWWGDERFLPPGHPDRNETQAREALLDKLPLDPALIHPMPADTGTESVESAACRYGDLIAAHPGRMPFDLVLLGVGPDGHVASLFPGHPATDRLDVDALGVRDSPKPPPLRISLTARRLSSSRQVWLLATGASKSDTVRRCLRGETHEITGSLPATRVQGQTGTRWFLDQAAVSE